MAKRRKVSAPSADDLNRIEEEFRRETLNKPKAALAPISQVSAETAQAAAITDPESCAAQKRTARTRRRCAKRKGRGG